MECTSKERVMRFKTRLPVPINAPLLWPNALFTACPNAARSQIFVEGSNCEKVQSADMIRIQQMQRKVKYTIALVHR